MVGGWVDKKRSCFSIILSLSLSLKRVLFVLFTHTCVHVHTHTHTHNCIYRLNTKQHGTFDIVVVTFRNYSDHAADYVQRHKPHRTVLADFHGKGKRLADRSENALTPETHTSQIGYSIDFVLNVSFRPKSSKAVGSGRRYM